MKKKSIILTVTTLLFVSISYAMTPCTDIFDECMESNPFNWEEGLHQFQAYYGYMQGCINFAEACIEQQ